ASLCVRALPGSDRDEARGDGRSGASPAEATGDRADVLDMRLGDALAALAGDRPRARLALVGDDEVVTGELRAVGTDVLTVRPDGANREPVYVALSGVIECSILGSG